MTIKKSISFLIGGSALAQIFTFAISPILTRLYSPEAFGILGTILAASSIIAVFSHLRFNLAIAQAKNLNEANIILKTAVFFSILLCVLSALFLALTNLIFDNSYSLIIVGCILVVSLFNSLIDIFNYWQSYRGKHSMSARNSIIRSLLTGINQILLSFITNFGLIFGVILGALGSLLFYLKEYRMTDNNKRHSIFNRKKICLVFAKYKNFPLYSMPQGFIASASLNSVPLILGSSFGMIIAGQYWLAYRILAAPIALIGGAYRQVLHPIFSNNTLDVNSKINIYRKHTYLLFILIFPFSIISFIILDKIFILIFGLNWLVAGKFSAWLVLSFSLDIIKVPTICFANATNLQKKLLELETISGLLRIGSILISIKYNDPVLTIKIFTLVSLLCVIFSIFYINLKASLMRESYADYQ